MAVTLVFAIAGVIAAVFWYRQVRTPEYAIARLGRALIERDRPTVERHLDIPTTSRQVVNSIIDIVAADAVESNEASGKTGGFAMAGVALGLSMLDKMRPVLATRLARTVNGSLAGTRDTTTLERAPGAMFPLFDLSSGLAGRDTSAYQFRGLGDRMMRADTAIVPIRYRDVVLDTTFSVGVMMVRRSGAWTVVGLDQVGEHFSTVNKLRRARIARANSVVRARLDSLMPVGQLTAQVTEAGYFDAYVMLRAPVTNQTRDTLTAVLVHLRGGDLDESTDDDFGLILNDGPVPPGEASTLRGTFKYNQFMDGHKTLRYMPELVHAQPTFAVWHGAAGRVDTLTQMGSWSEYLRFALDRRGQVRSH